LDGIVIPFVNAPDASVVACANNVYEVPKKILMLAFDPNPDPVTVTLEPGGPLVGDNVTSGAAFALSKPIVIILARRIDITNKVTYFCTAISR
jgi:hypothetical protein